MEMELRTEEYKEFQSLIYSESGIKLEDGKEHLIHFRLSERLSQLGMRHYRTYLDWVKRPEGNSEIVHMLDAISTNVTGFFREPAHFDFIKEMVLDARKKGRKQFRFWSAACSSGEEPYSLAMALNSCGLPADTELKITGSDLSTKILKAAQDGIYDEAKIAGLPSGLLAKYFFSRDTSRFEIKPEIKAMVHFQRQNLLSTPFDIQGPLDFIFLRNVMIYFDTTVRNKIIEDCYRLLRPGGFLLIGHSETLNGLDSRFKCIKPSYYLKATI